MTAKDRFAELEKKVQQVADRLNSAHDKHADERAELERLRAEMQKVRSSTRELEEEIKSLKKERDLIKNKVERILSAIDHAGSE